MKRRKGLLSEEELLLRDKVHKASKRASETREQTLHRQEQNRTHAVNQEIFVTVFARSDAAATIYFIAQFCAASIRERLLIKSGIY